MAAVVASIAVVLLGVAICMRVGRSRPPGGPVTWGEAFLAGTFVFAIMVVAYGVVPHQWLTYADKELLWRSDKLLIGISSKGVKLGQKAKTLGGGGRILVNYQALRDLVAAVFYAVFLGLQVVLWSKWQKRGRARTEVEPSSAFGRPIVRKA